MTQELTGDQVALAAVLALAAGPTVAGLHETGTLSVGPAATLWPVVSVVVAATLGVLVAGWIMARRSRLLGVVVLIPNVLVLLVYGFLLVFFGLGGSR
jgi:hypothetical protein